MTVPLHFTRPEFHSPNGLVASFDGAMQKKSEGRITTGDIYAAIPDLGQVDEKWFHVLQVLFPLLMAGQMLHTPAHDGRWVTPQECYLDQKPPSPQMQVAKELLISTGYMVVTPPVHIFAALDKYRTTVYRTVTARLVREALKQHYNAYRCLSDAQKLALLEVILEDDTFDELQGIELIPVDDGTFKQFQPQSTQSTSSSLMVIRDHCCLAWSPSSSEQTLIFHCKKSSTQQQHLVRAQEDPIILPQCAAYIILSHISTVTTYCSCILTISSHVPQLLHPRRRHYCVFPMS